MTTAEPKIADAVPSVIEPVFSQITNWPLEAIRESEWNPRRHYDPAALEQLAESIIATGQVTPGLARPTPDTIDIDADVWRVVELAAGHRRFRALQALADLRPQYGVMRLEVRPMEDTEFLEVLQVENLHRDDLDPLEEADGYRLLMERIGYGIDRVVERVGRPRAYIYDRLRLLKLVPAAQEWLREGLLPLGQAVILSRLSPSEQERVTGTRDQDYRDGALWQSDYHWGVADMENRGETPRDGEEEEDPVHRSRAVSVRALQSWVDRHIRFRATEDEVAPELFPEAVEVEQTAEPIRVTYEHQVHPEARDAEGARTWCARSWKRADGLYGSVTCEHAQPAIIVVGPGRGQALQACTAKKSCPVHWKSEMRQAKQAAKRRAVSPANPGKAAEIQPPKDLTDNWLQVELDTRCMGLIPAIKVMAAELVATPDEVAYNLAQWVEDGAASWNQIGHRAIGFGTDYAESCRQILVTALPGEWETWSGGWGDRRYPQAQDAVGPEARLHYLAALLCLARDTGAWDKEIQEALAERSAAWRREQETPAPIPCTDCGHDLTKPAPAKKAAKPKTGKPKKRAGDVRRAKKAAKKREAS